MTTHTPAPRTANGTLKPTRKWIAAAVAGALTIIGHAIATEGWDETEWGELLTLGAALAASYVRPNDKTPGGVPAKRP